MFKLGKSKSKPAAAAPDPASVMKVDEHSFRLAGGHFDEWLYLHHNPDVALSVRAGQSESGEQHFTQWGLEEYRQGRRPLPPTTRELSYRLRNPDIAAAIAAGKYTSGHQHWLQHGREEESSGKRKPYRSSASADVSDFDLATWADGYVILPGLFSAQQCDAVIEVTQKMWRDRSSIRQPIDVDVFLNTPQERKLVLSEAPEEAAQHPFKINNLYYWTPEVRAMVLDPRLCRAIRHLIDGDPVAFTSLNFRKGSEQGYHLDTFYMPPLIPHRMVAVWIALEDVSPENGPLKYIPGSNRLPPYFFDGHRLRVNNSPTEYEAFSTYYLAKLRENGLPPKTFAAKKGDALIWHALLYHGGDPILDPNATRQSVVAHFFPAADYPGGSCTGATRVIEHAQGCYYEDRPPSVKASLLPPQYSFG